MRWQGREQSKNVDDRRGTSMRKVGGGIGIGGILLVILAVIFGQDPSALLGGLMSGNSGQIDRQETNYQPSQMEEELAGLVKVVLKDTEDVWADIFNNQIGRPYKPATLVLYTEMDQSACGHAQRASGPFYCPADQTVYIDLSFYNELRNRFNAPGDFAMAYVVAHEVAHHVQNLLGITSQMDAQRGRISKEAYNDLSVRLELQADFFAGVWAHHAHRKSNILESGDLEEAMRAAAAIGDDRIQMQSRGYVVPESFTHGTSEQRMRWLRRGLETGDVTKGDTFAVKTL